MVLRCIGKTAKIGRINVEQWGRHARNVEERTILRKCKSKDKIEEPAASVGDEDADTIDAFVFHVKSQNKKELHRVNLP